MKTLSLRLLLLLTVFGLFYPTDSGAILDLRSPLLVRDIELKGSLATGGYRSDPNPISAQQDANLINVMYEKDLDCILINVYDLNNEIVFSKSTFASYGYSEEICIEALLNGIYKIEFLQISTGKYLEGYFDKSDFY